MKFGERFAGRELGWVAEGEKPHEVEVATRLLFERAAVVFAHGYGEDPRAVLQEFVE
jgi:hypothetical protein